MPSLFLILGLLLHATSIFAAPYIVTSYVEISTYTYRGLTRSYTTRPESLELYTQGVSPTATPVDAISTITDDSSYAQVTVVEVVLPNGSGATPTEDDNDSYLSYTATEYVVPITYTPSASCTGQAWTFVKNVTVDVPRIALAQMTPITVSASATTYTYGYDDKVTRATAMVALLNPTDISADDLAEASSDGKPYGLSSYCYTPTTYCTTRLSIPTCIPTFEYDSSSGSSSSSSSSSYDYYYCDDCWIRDVIIIAVCVPVGWIVLWLLIGLWESWMSFKGIMLGRHRKRGVPYSWCCISFLFLCCVGPTYKGKSVEEQAVLLERWKAMKAGEKFKLWLKWGFRWKYPDMLGEAPEMDHRALRQRCL